MPLALRGSVFALCLGLLSASPVIAGGGCGVVPGSDRMQSELLAHLNAERKARGLKPVTLNPALDRAAQRHACDNAARLSISHVSSDGSRLTARLQRSGYRYRTAAENTGRGFASGARAVEWWMDSPGHRKNILLADVREIGIGIALSDAPDGRLHWVINLGAQR